MSIVANPLSSLSSPPHLLYSPTTSAHKAKKRKQNSRKTIEKQIPLFPPLFPLSPPLLLLSSPSPLPLLPLSYPSPPPLLSLSQQARVNISQAIQYQGRNTWSGRLFRSTRSRLANHTHCRCTLHLPLTLLRNQCYGRTTPTAIKRQYVDCLLT